MVFILIFKRKRLKFKNLEISLRFSLLSPNENLHNYLINRDENSLKNYFKNNEKRNELEIVNSLIFGKISFLYESLKLHNSILTKIDQHFEEDEKFNYKMNQLKYFKFKANNLIFNEMFQYLFQEIIRENGDDKYLNSITCAFKAYIQSNIEQDFKIFLDFSLKSFVNFDFFKIEDNDILFQIASHYLIECELEKNIEPVPTQSTSVMKNWMNYFYSKEGGVKTKDINIYDVLVLKFKERKDFFLSECLNDLKLKRNFGKFSSWNQTSNKLISLSSSWIEEIILNFIMNDLKNEMFYKLFILNVTLNDFNHFNFEKESISFSMIENEFYDLIDKIYENFE
jgi:hypothetical protein